MAGTITKSIGTSSRDYSTIQAWEDAIPANLVTVDEIWIGECYNDSEFAVNGAVVSIAGSTTGVDNYIKLTCASGQSFRDNANVRTNALRYNQSNGVGLKTNSGGGYTVVLTCTVNYTRISGLQVIETTTSGSGTPKALNATGSNMIVENCIFECTSPSGICADIVSASGVTRNCLFISRRSSAGSAIQRAYETSASFINCTMVRPSDLTSADSGILSPSGANTATVKNCVVMNFSNFTNTTSKHTGSNNASDGTVGFGSSNQESLTYSSQFEVVTDSSRDFRAKSGGALIDNGVTDATHGTPDISNTARPIGSAYDIGCWEAAAAAAGRAPPPIIIQQQSNHRAASW